MNNFIRFLSILSLFCILSCHFADTTTDYEQSINPVIGDVSYTKQFGVKPDEFSDETTRIQTHLTYVEQLLRKRDVSGLTADLQERRREMLDLLARYSEAGIFPANYDYPETRKPCFIDKYGKICAVGYLVEQTAGREVAEHINDIYQYEYLAVMDLPEIDAWIETSGLTKEECAMIQPMYGIAYEDHAVPVGYGLTSGLLTGINLSVNSMNIIQISKGTNRKIIPIAGLATGAGQVLIGALGFSEYEDGRGMTYVNASRRNWAAANIGMGTSTLLLSSWNLITNRQKKDNAISWNLYGFPSKGNPVGFSLSKTF
jgi:hypothetical protein